MRNTNMNLNTKVYCYDVMTISGLKLKLLTSKILNNNDKKIIIDNSPVKHFDS